MEAPEVSKLRLFLSDSPDVDRLFPKIKFLEYENIYHGILLVNGIQNLRYPKRFDNNQWHFGKRQDLLAQSRYFMWKPAINPSQLRSSAKAPIIPHNFNRYGIASPAAMAPVLQNYMFTMPTKVNYPKAWQLHHITIINAIMPKPYLPTPPTYAHPTTTFRNYRTNNKFLHQQYLNNFARQNLESFNNINTQHKLQQQHQMVYPLNTYSLNMNKPTIDYANILKYTAYNNNRNESNDINIKAVGVTPCDRKNKDDSNNSGSDIMYYYCNNRITNYKNPTQYQIVSTQTTTPPTTSTTSTSTTTTTTSTTTERPSTTTARSVLGSFTVFTTEKPIFLPTPNEPVETNYAPVASLANTENHVYLNYRDQYRSKNYENIRSDSFQPYQTRQSLIRYDDIRRKQQQQQYTTTSAYDSMKLHSFFTIEDAVTRAPEMQVFNDPYQAYRHARRHHYSHQRPTTTPFMTTTTTTTTKKPKYKSFFDELDDEDYTTSESHHYDYSFFGNPQKSVYQKPEFRSESKYAQPNQIIDQTYKSIDDNSFFTEPYQVKPKIKEQNFDLFQAISPTTYTAPPITTYKPYGIFKSNISVTTHRIPHTSATYKLKPTPTATTELIWGSPEEKINFKTETTTGIYPLQIQTSTVLPITTTTERKTNRIKLKSLLTLKTPTTYKYPKQRGLKKPTTTSTTTSTTTTATPATTIENYTKRASSRIYSTTSTTEEPTTRKISLRNTTTTDSTRPRKSSGRKLTSTTQPTNTRKKPIIRLAVESTTLANIPSRKQASRRGTKRVHNTKTEKEVSSTIATSKRGEHKSRRRLSSTSTTPKLGVTRSTSSLSSTTSLTAASQRSSSTSTTTTMRSIMRIANSKSRSRPLPQSEFRSSIKTPNDIHNDETNIRGSLKSITSTEASVPPLPIEIYFKKSQIAKI
ncbi:hypothetical protein DOY81_000234 [Sarcophaga bullata]|nr:hypothetical protein DOY81_000234 [Sarcophaga bullata]